MDTIQEPESPTVRIVTDVLNEGQSYMPKQADKADQLHPRVVSYADLSATVDQIIDAINEANNVDADCRALLTAVRALIARIQARKPRRAYEVLMLLRGVVDIVLLNNDVSKAKALYDEAYSAFAQSAGSGNQIYFFLGAVIGAVTMIVLTIFAIILQTAATTKEFLSLLASPNVIVGVSFFAVAGSLTSILLRLRKIDLVEEDETFMVALTGGLQPVVAMGFMCIVYVIVATPLIPLNAIGEMKTGIEFAAAFLCGFSEKFAPTLLDRVGTVIGTTSGRGDTK